MSTLSIRRAAGVIAALALVLALPLIASAESFSVELPRQVIRGTEGERVPLGTFDVPSQLVGQSCRVTAVGNNNHSVHPSNDILVTSVNTVLLRGVENSPNKTTTANDLLVVGEQVSFTLRLGPDPVYSAEFTVQFDCQAQQTTTTTSSTTSSTTTSTTEPTTTSTTEPTTTSTTVQGTSTTTTIPTTTTTEEPETTSTTSPPEVQQETTTTAAPASTLPFTGADSDTLGLLALVGVVAGSALVLTTRQSEEAKASHLE